ncbi:hypothetical protein JJB74_16450 [Noviherbaspirillum sp. DKR-6]|uniref:Uncharacterized protein n=1 Tax=Noviherbaspirillum pedocola TaxID=2801341 RepID=A0A934STB5_9BURK|nr:hypothetical protein [Noviherbaspirillum pedocola]
MARAALNSALAEHARQCGLAPDWHKDLDIACYGIAPGCGYRDREYVASTCASAATEPDMPLYQREFPGFGDLGVSLPEGFEDASWHNDACPSFDKLLPNGQYLRIWIDFKEAADREFSERMRFSLGLYDHEISHLRDLLDSEDFVEICRAIEAFKPQVTPFQMIRDAAHMTRDQQNDWYEENVGYRPDDGEHIEDDELTLQVAEMMFYHAKESLEAGWAAVDAHALLVFICADDVANNRSSQQHNA